MTYVLALSILFGLTPGMEQSLFSGKFFRQLFSCESPKELSAPKESALTAEITSSKAVSSPANWILLPNPRSIEFFEGACPFAGTDQVEFRNLSEKDAAMIEARLQKWESEWEGLPAMAFQIDSVAMPHTEGYHLLINAQGIQITAHDSAGLFYSMMTLAQIQWLSAGNGSLPCLEIQDWPDFPNRGVVLDIARDKVPEMETLYALVDLLASIKYNQFQLYTEHTFAYRNHPIVWQDASPMTPAQIQALDAYCKERFMTLVPNQNSFGHRERWLQHAEYRHLAEVPEGGMDLCAIDPESIKHLEDLYTDLLPNFSGPYFNVGCDETWSLGKGRSKPETDVKGVGRVYLEFLLKIHELVKQSGKRMMFWGDIIMLHPELIPELPKDLIALEWGYEANHPFAEHGKTFAASGIPYYVCPGTSAWNTLLGRTDNAIANLRNAAENGLANGAEGFLVTDWGDSGHWQQLPVSYLGYAQGAAVSWCAASNRELDIQSALSSHVFKDKASVMGKLMFDLGNTYQKAGMNFGNSNIYYHLLLYKPASKIEDGLSGLTIENLESALKAIDEAMSRLSQAEMACADRALIPDEVSMGADMARLACRLGIERIKAGGVPTAEIPKEIREPIAAELQKMITEYRQIWLRRNRSGGLKDSAGRLESLLAMLKQ